MQLMGDPLLRVKRPERINLTAPKSATAGDTISVTGEVASATNENSGPVRVHLSYQRDRLKHRFKRRRTFASTTKELAKFQAVYDQARDLICVEETVAMVDGKFEAQLALPDSIRGACVITCCLIDNDGILAGSAKIEIKKANR